MRIKYLKISLILVFMVEPGQKRERYFCPTGYFIKIYSNRQKCVFYCFVNIVANQTFVLAQKYIGNEKKTFITLAIIFSK